MPALKLLAALVIVSACPAWADRHCGPVLDSYYQARNAALDDGASCTAAIDTAMQRLDETRTNARTCGCTGLIDALDGALAAVPDADSACETRRAAVLDDGLDARIKALVQDCH